MRTLLTIVIIVILLLGGSLSSYYYIQTSTQALGVPLEAVEQSISTRKWEVAQNELSATQLNWDKNKTLLTILLDHRDIEAIDSSIMRLVKYIEVHDFSLSLGEISVLKLLVDNVYESAKLNWKNIL